MVGRFLHPFTSPSRTEHLRIVRGEGSLIYDDAGKEYVDAMAALWFANVGYGRREIVEAMARQASTLHTYHAFDPFTLDPADELADRIAAIAPVDDPRVFFTCSGSEAVDTAIKLARAAHQRAGDADRQVVVSRGEGYHGTNLGGTSAQGLEANRVGWGDLAPHFVQVPPHDIEAMSRLFTEEGHRIAAVISEPVQGAGGVIPPVEGYWSALRRLCDDHGAFLIADEVICGFGRLGSWFGSEHFGVRPDLITFAKGVTSGYVPLGGVIVGQRVREPLEADPGYVLKHGYTYSGHATACAAAMACLDVTESDGLLDRAKILGDRLRAGLATLVDDGLYAGLRGEGFVWALEVHGDQEAPEVRNRALAHGVVVRPLVGAIAFCPPLVITEEQVDRVVDAVAASARP